MYLNSITHRKELFDLATRWFADCPHRSDGHFLTQVVSYENLISAPVVRELLTTIRQAVNPGPLSLERLSSKDELRMAIIRACKDPTPRESELFEYYRANPEDFFPGTPSDLILGRRGDGSILGMARIKSMATFVAVNNMVRSSVHAPALRKVWVHSVVTAIVAEQAARISRLDSEFAYTAGLLHNLGILGLMSAYPDEYCRMLDVFTDFGFELLQTERDLFDIDHCEAGAYLARDWSFPHKLAVAIAAHHDEPVSGELSIDNVVKVSWRLADTLGYAAFPPAKDWAFEDLIAYFPPAPNSWLVQSPESAKAELETRLSASPL